MSALGAVGGLVLVVAAVTPPPGQGPAPDEVTPGILGFLVTLAVVLACIPLFRSMTSKVRGVQPRAGVGEDDQRGPEDGPSGEGGPPGASPSDGAGQ